MYPPLAGGGLIEAALAKKAFDYPEMYPPLAGGGLIEAIHFHEVWGSRARYPPLAGGGLIEAAKLIAVSYVVRLGIRRSRAAASLKHIIKGMEYKGSVGYPPLAGGGLIEAAHE